MSKSSTILILIVLLVNTAAPGADAVPSKKAKPLRDGFALSGVDGKLISADSNEASQNRLVSFEGSGGWFFKLDSDLSDNKGLIKAGSAIELLPSVELEKMTVDMKERSARSYRLWGRVTQYRGGNFIFPEYFLPLSKIQAQPLRQGRGEPQSQTSQKSQQRPDRPTINEPNDALTIPKEIIAKLQTRRTIRPEQPPEQSGTQVELTQDFILVERTAVLVEPAQPLRQGLGLFALDALGRNTQESPLRLLPCQVLERTQVKQSVEPEQLRFKIAGRVTKYKGEYYLLLQRAIRVYSHGNFGG